LEEIDLMLPPLQYFFPKYGKTVPPAALKKVFAGRPVNRSQSSAIGPGEQRGTFFSYFENTMPGYDPAQCRFAKFKAVTVDGEIEYFIIVTKDADSYAFRREETLPGTGVEMEHGEWLIPVANPLVESCVIPYFEMTENGDDWFKEYKEQYLDATQVALELAGQMRELASASQDGVDSINMTSNDLRRVISTMIGVNYRLTLNEMVALRLFDNEKYLDLVAAFVDAPETFRMMEDKHGG